jgi:DHA1 family bicyclomycin/chloramphenicol resistance-like MFS transporter
LKKARLVALIAFLAMFIPLSMDMYLPALPQMLAFFGTSEIIMNSTLYMFFFLMAMGMLLFGPLSDKFGRKRVLLPCSVGYCLASLCCALSGDIAMLLASRSLQALCVGGLVAISTTLVKDAFDGRQRDAILGVSQAMSLVAPVIAPVIGAFVLQFFPWQADFVILAVLGMAALALGIAQPETLPEEDRLTTGVFSSWLHLGKVARDKGFSFYLLVTSIPPIGYMAYISSSSYIFQGFFGLSELEFGFCYAANAFATVIASLAFIKISAKLKPAAFTLAVMALIGVSGALMLALGSLAPAVFLLAFLPCAFCSTLLKPLATSVLLRQCSGDVGSAASLINFVQTIFSFIGLVLGSIPWASLIGGLGGTIFASAALALLGWVALRSAKNINIAAFKDKAEGV